MYATRETFLQDFQLISRICLLVIVVDCERMTLCIKHPSPKG